MTTATTAPFVCGACGAALPFVVRYVPMLDGRRFAERHEVDNIALLDHLRDECPSRVPS